MEKHEERDHALLSASGSSRWLNCTPSARIEEELYPKNDTGSVYAREGTLAHELAELELSYKFGSIKKVEYYQRLESIKEHELYSSEMPEEVAKYVDYVWEEYLERSKKAESTLLIEQKFDLTSYVPEGFGTGDSSIISEPLLEIVDLKYGRGNTVYAPDNPQLKLYGLGALEELSLLYEIETVKLTIVQPRLNHFSSFEISVEELLDWGENEVRPKAEKAFKGEGDFKAGEWCKWCKFKATCKTLGEKALSIAKEDFTETKDVTKALNPSAYSDEELIDIYDKLPLFEIWAGAVREHFLAEALEGKKWPGLKLVAGRSSRKIVDEEGVIEALKKRKIRLTDFMPRKLLGITGLEKLLGAKKFQKALGPYIVKAEGKPTLVAESDKRPEIGGVASAKNDFE